MAEIRHLVMYITLWNLWTDYTCIQEKIARCDLIYKTELTTRNMVYVRNHIDDLIAD